MTTRLILAGISHETNTYCSRATAIGDFQQLEADEVRTEYVGTRTYVGGILDAAAEIGAVVVAAYHAIAVPSGTIAGDAYSAMRSRLLATVAGGLPADAVVLTLHGAGVAEGLDDIEADLCRAVREIVGIDMPMVVTLDLHGNITGAMAEHVQVMLGDHEYPHVDMYERGHEAVHLVPSLLQGALHPVTHVERLPMLLPTTTTTRGPLMAVNELCGLYEERAGVIDVTFFHGFPYTDVPIAGSSVVVTTDGDPALASTIAKEVATFVWGRREEFRTESLTPKEAIRRALDIDGAPIVINETSDNPGGGAPGDGTHLLRAMLDAQIDNACFGYIVDAETVGAARAAGAGSAIDVKLGGKTDALHGQPIEAHAYVKALTDGEFRLTAFGAGSRASMGPAARLRIGGLDVIVGSRRAQTFDVGPFLLHGVDVTRSKIVALKSSHHFRAAFEPLAKAIVTADPPGMTTLRIESFERRRTSRPVWPLDYDADYTLRPPDATSVVRPA